MNKKRYVKAIPSNNKLFMIGDIVIRGSVFGSDILQYRERAIIIQLYYLDVAIQASDEVKSESWGGFEIIESRNKNAIGIQFADPIYGMRQEQPRLLVDFIESVL